MDKDIAATAIKWAATILAAGFIAQFGKKFADHLIISIKRKREWNSMSDGPARKEDPPHPGDVIVVQAAAEAKLAKKRMKMKKKTAKKSKK